MDNLKKMGLRIKTMRKELGLTQEELAHKIGLKGRSAIAGYEVGKIGPKNEIKIELCKLFNCNMDYLMGIIEEKEDQSLILKKKIEQLKRQIKIKDNYLELMWQIGQDYDGYETPEGLKGVIDDIMNLCKKAGISDDKYQVYMGGRGFKRRFNILHEEIFDYKEED